MADFGTAKSITKDKIICESSSISNCSTSSSEKSENTKLKDEYIVGTEHYISPEMIL